MKITFLIQDCTTVGGTERVTCSLASEMAREGHEVAILSVFGTGGGCKFPLDSRVRFVVACGMDYNLQMSKMKRMLVLARIARRVRSEELLNQADVVIAQKFFAATMALLTGFRAKLIVGDHYPYRLYGQPWLKIRDMIYRKAKAVVVLTEGCRQDFVRNGVSKVEVVGNMLPITAGPTGQAREKMILAVGRLSEEKGFDTLIKAVYGIKERMGEWHVEICGDGDERERLEALIRQFGLQSSVLLRGRVDDVAAEYSRAAFCVVPSRYEGFSLVILESAAMGVPVVAFDCPYGPGEILATGGGMLVENQNTDALGDAMLRMIEDVGLRDIYADETRKIVERFSPQKIYSQWMQVIAKYL